MSENYSFRSAINGFNRSDVITYIDEILNKKSSENNETEELERKLSAAEEKIRFLSSELKKAEDEKTQHDNDVEISKVYEARLGAAMLDAKRFSEILVQEANDKASGLFSEALSSAHDTYEKAELIIKNIKRIKNELNFSIDTLLSNLGNICSSLSSFEEDIKSTGGLFTFSSDFLPVGPELDAKLKEKMDENTTGSEKSDNNTDGASSDDEAAQTSENDANDTAETSNEDLKNTLSDDSDDSDVEFEIKVDFDD